jgi:hypothetical protein
LFDLIFALKAGYRQNATFVMNRKTQSVIRKMKTATGEYLWAPPMVAGGQASLLNFPLVEVEDMSDIGAGTSAIAFGNFERGYLIVDRVGVRPREAGSGGGVLAALTGPRWSARWLAAGVGLAGVLIVLGPHLSGAGSGWWSLVMLAASPLFAASFLINKALTRQDSPSVIVFWQNVAVMLLNAVTHV